MDSKITGKKFLSLLNACVLSLVILACAACSCASFYDAFAEVPSVSAETVTDEYFTDKDSAAAYVRACFTGRETGFTMYYLYEGLYEGSGDWSVISAIRNTAMSEHTGVPDEGDYLYWSFSACNFNFEKVGVYAEGTLYLVTWIPKYYTTAAQEEQVSSAVSSVLSSLDLAGKSDYEKAKAIYGWICSNVTYDASADYMYTAYGAIIGRRAVCQGFAVLLYRMALEAGLDARCVAGDNHMWNIVGIDGTYYYVDATWDSGKSEYDYFLIGSATMGLTHSLYEGDYMYGTALASQYNISISDYIVPSDSVQQEETETSGSASEYASGDTATPEEETSKASDASGTAADDASVSSSAAEDEDDDEEKTSQASGIPDVAGSSAYISTDAGLPEIYLFFSASGAYRDLLVRTVEVSGMDTSGNLGCAGISSGAEAGAAVIPVYMPVVPSYGFKFK